jgi:ADP-heptose:LPS heptosyltransferase
VPLPPFSPAQAPAPAAAEALPAEARILVVRFSSLGDVVKCTALPRLIKRAYPRAHLTFVTAADYLELIRDNPHIDRPLGFPRREGLGGLLRLSHELKRGGVDLVVDVHRSLRSRMLTALLPAPRVPYSKRTLQRWLLIQFRVNTYRRAVGKEEDFLAGLRRYGVDPDGRGTEVFLARTLADEAMRRRLAPEWERYNAWRAGGLPVLGVAPVAAWELKRWPTESFRALMAGFIRATGGGVLVFGGPKDSDAQRLAGDFGGQAVSLVGKTSHLESACFASLADLVVSNDTAMTHLTEAAGRDVLTIYGPTSRELGYYPTRPGSIVVERDLPCRPCTRMGEGRCTHPLQRACLVGITPDQVLARVLAKLEQQRPGAM